MFGNFDAQDHVPGCNVKDPQLLQVSKFLQNSPTLSHYHSCAYLSNNRLQFQIWKIQRNVMIQVKAKQHNLEPTHSIQFSFIYIAPNSTNVISRHLNNIVQFKPI